MASATRSTPEFAYDSQKELYATRKLFATTTGFPFNSEFEEAAISALTIDQASTAVAQLKEHLGKYNAQKSKKKGKKAKTAATGDEEQRESSEQRETSETEGANPSDELDELSARKADNEGTKPKGTPEPDDSDSSSTDDESDPRKRTSRRDKKSIRGRTPRIEASGTLSKKLFKMDPPEKYKGEADSDRTYAAVHKFLSQLSRYLRLSTNVDMDDDISEYVLGFLDGFAFEWFELLDKGRETFKWNDFETAFRQKFIPKGHRQAAINKYITIKQGDRPVSEYIVEREKLEATLGTAISEEIKESSFRKGLNKHMKDNMVAFHGQRYEEYKRSAEEVDQDAKERRVGHYAPKQNTSSSKSTENSNAKKSAKTEKSPKKTKLSREEMIKQGICFECGEKGHIAKACTKKKKTHEPTIETNSIRIHAATPHQEATPHRNPAIPTISIANGDAKPPPMFGYIPINGVLSKTLFDTGGSDDFVGTHFATTNRVSTKRYENPLSIQQAIQGSKPKCNATAVVNIKFGEWTRKSPAYVARLAGYDAIIGMPTMNDGDAVIYVKERKIYFRQWDFTIHCTIPEQLPKPPKFDSKWKRGRNQKKRTTGPSKPPKPMTPAALAHAPAVMAIGVGTNPSESVTTTITDANSAIVAPTAEVRTDGTVEYYRELLLKEFDDILVDKLPNKLPPLREINHRIPFKPKTPWIAHKYRLPEAHKQALERDVNAKLQSGILRYTSEIPLAASHMVPKSEPDSYRHVQDLRKRNADTESMAWPMPDQEELVHNIARSSNGSIFDLISAFDQTRIYPDDEKYATIINHMGVLQQRTIQQGDKNAVATQQRTMQHHLQEDWGKNVTVYVDDGTIYDERPGMSLYDHYKTCHRILSTLRKHQFYLARKKTHFFIDMENEGIDVLGRHVQDGEISIAKSKVDGFLALGSPTSFQELGKDLGMFTWLTDHLPFAASISAPLHALYHSGRWEWTESHENAFRRMKEIVGGHEVLVPLDLSAEALPIRVVSDASLAGIGGYICQGQTLETSKPAVYHSRVFTSPQSNYPVHEQELLALEDLVKSYEHWLIGRPFTAVTDSQAMLSLLKQKRLSPRQWRSVIYLSKFDITFEFVEGKKNIIADLLSRIAERSTYKRNLSFVEESDAQIAAIQLRRGKTLLDEPQIKKRSKSTPHAPRA